MAPADRRYTRPPGLPGNQDTERDLLGCLLLAPDRLADVRPILDASHFRTPKHGELYDLILDMERRGKRPDAPIVADEIETRGDAERFGGIGYVERLSRDAPPVETTEGLARQIRAHADRRALILAARQIEADARDPAADMSGPLAALGIRAVDVRRLADRRAGAFLGASIERFHARGNGREAPIPLPSAWSRTADTLSGGLWPGAHMLVGGTKVGKSQWAFEVVYHAAVVHRYPVAYVGLELDEPGMIARLFALGCRRGIDGRGGPGGPSWRDVWLGRPRALAALESPYGRSVLDAINRAPVHLESGEAREGWPYTRIGTLAAELRREHPTGPALLVVDFLQLVSAAPGQRREELRERIAGAAYLARMAARKHGIAVLLISSTARNFYPLFAGVNDKGGAELLGAGDLGRFVGTGKESGEVEYAADSVLALGRQRAPDGTPGHLWLGVAASRVGLPSGLSKPAGWVAYKFTDGCVFEEVDACDSVRASEREWAARKAKGHDGNDTGNDTGRGNGYTPKGGM